MDVEFWNLAQAIVPSMQQACNAVKVRERLIKMLLDTKKLPETGWDSDTIELFLHRLSFMDSNNYITNCGLGEQDGRFYSDIIAQRHYNFSQGIGIMDLLSNVRPNAVGSTLMYELTNAMIQDIFKIMDIRNKITCALLPFNNDVTLIFCLLSMKAIKPNAKYVIWSRYDQGNTLSSILSVGCLPIIIDQRLKGESFETNTDLIEEKLKSAHEEGILCILSATSCLAPRSCDNIEQIARICKFYKIYHIINNSFGLHSKYIMGRIQKAQKTGRIDVIINSADKNLLVPVGSTIIAGFDRSLIIEILKTIPGPLSTSIVIDVFVTLLSMGQSGFKKLLQTRDLMHSFLVTKLADRSAIYGEHILRTADNPLSLALSLQSILQKDLIQMGTNLLARNIAGVTVSAVHETKTVGAFHIKDWGCHGSGLKYPFLSCVVGLGVTERDILTFLQRLEKMFGKYRESTEEADIS